MDTAKESTITIRCRSTTNLSTVKMKSGSHKLSPIRTQRWIASSKLSLQRTRLSCALSFCAIHSVICPYHFWRWRKMWKATWGTRNSLRCKVACNRLLKSSSNRSTSSVVNCWNKRMSQKVKSRNYWSRHLKRNSLRFMKLTHKGLLRPLEIMPILACDLCSIWEITPKRSA